MGLSYKAHYFAVATKQMQDEQKIMLQQAEQMNNIRRK
jgi:hypothetical protein